MKDAGKKRAMTPDEIAEEIANAEPMFDSLAEAARALGWSDAFTAWAALGMELTRPRQPGDVVH